MNQGHEDHLHCHPSEVKGHPDDCNAHARRRAESKSRGPSAAFDSGWEYYMKHRNGGK